MRTNETIKIAGWTTCLLISAVIWSLWAVDASVGSPPLDPLPVPSYSFDLISPATTNGIVTSDSVLAVQDFPFARFDAVVLGLGRLADDIDGLSGRHTELTYGDQFVLLFSVDRTSVGNDIATDPALVNMGVPYDAADQARKGQAAGDMFMTVAMFEFGDKPGVRSVRGASTNGIASHTLAANNFDEGGRDFMAFPTTAARSSGNATAAKAANEDNVDALAYLSSNGAPTGLLKSQRTNPLLFFTVAANSRSLDQSLPGHLPSNSPADIFVDADLSGGGNEELYVSAADLNLIPALDDIDALLVIDVNYPGVWDAGDQILFSLSRGSASVVGMSPADVFKVDYFTPPGTLERFATADRIGLDAQDNVDGLELAACVDSYYCAGAWGIRLWNDYDRDGDVDLDDFIEFQQCVGGPWQDGGATQPTPLCLEVFDADPDGFPDGDLDLADFQAFQQDFTGPGPF